MGRSEQLTRVRRAWPLLAIVGGVLGWFGGVLWWSLFGPPYGDFGSAGEGLTEAVRGAAVGAGAGALFGWALGRVERRPAGVLAALGLGAIAAAVLVVTGISYLGDWTNADGPGAEGIVGVLAIPAGVALAVALARRARRRSAPPG